MALNSGICDEAEDIGRSLQQKLDNIASPDISFIRREQAKNLLFLYSKIRIEKQDESIDPPTLFLRLTFAIERREGKDSDSNSELRPYIHSKFTL